MQRLHAHHPLRIFWVSALITLILGGLVAWFGSLADLWLYAILVILEVTFSFDNAVINSKVLTRMSPRWQMLFLTVGIFIAVFVVRFALPIFIVMMASGVGFSSVIDMAMNNPKTYSHTLHEAAPAINAFGGAFLLMIGINYFMDRKKDIHWLGWLEKKLAAADRWQFIKTIVMLILTLIIFLTVDDGHKYTVLTACLFGIALHIGLEFVGSLFEKRQAKNITHQVGWAAFASFMYLNVLDASFSLDGVIGAFAITTDVLLIVAGLGAGALWVRSLTIHLVRSNTLGKYLYLEHGAHWAILALGSIMLLKLYHIELPEWLVGSLGMIFVMTAVISSVIEKRRQNQTS